LERTEPGGHHANDLTADTVSLGDSARPQPRLERGVCIGRYVIVGWVGEGGMGIVYKAYDPELERAVALKLLHTAGNPDSLSAEGRRERLLREAKALARLSHPNVVSIFDVGTFGADVFLATEFVEGSTLASWVKDEKPSRARILSALLEAGEGLAAAHRAGLVHRDFKPSNAIVAKDGRVRVLDFGLARAESSGGADAQRAPTSVSSGANTPQSGTMPDAVTAETARVDESVTGQTASPSPSSTSSPSAGLLNLTITQLGQVLGTPRFMAPEQHLGLTADARSDQFSFCVTLYDSLYGELPFDGRGDDYARNVTLGRVRAAPAGSDVPRRLRLILIRGLAVAPNDRFESMDELLRALREDPSATRKRWLTIAGGAVLLLGMGLELRHARPVADTPCRGAERKLAGVWDDARKQAVHAAFAATGSPGAEDAFERTRAALDDYARGWVAMHTDACEATQVRGEQSAELLDLRVECLGDRLEDLRAQVDVFTHADPSIVGKAVQAARGLPRLQACADSAALRAPVRPPSDEQKRARTDAVRTELARAKAEQRAGDYPAALAIAEKSASEAAALGYRPIEAEALYVLGDVQDDRGNYPESEKTLRASFAAALAGRHEAQAARTLTALVAGVGLRQARFGEAHEWAKLAEAEIERSSDPFIKGELARNEGRVLVREGKYDDARAAIEKCLSIWEPALGKDDYAVAGAVTDLGNVFLEQEDLVSARAEYSRSLAILEKILGPDSPLLAPNLNNLGDISISLGDSADAAKSFERARALWERALGPDHPKVALALYNLARSRQGDAAASLAMAQRALGIWRAALPPEHPDVAMGLHGVAEALRATGDYDAALAAEERALALREKVYGPNAGEVAESLASIGETRLAQGSPAAIAPLTRALHIVEPLAEDPLGVASVKFDLAQALAVTDPARSRALATEAHATYAASTSTLARQKTVELDAWLARAHR
jgi:eukaryotic-like serine/threonine-protein kinase